MASEPMNLPEADERGQRLLSELRNLLMRQAADPFRSTPISGLTLARSATTSPCMISGLYAPMVCIIAQGSKQIVVGNSTLDWRRRVTGASERLTIVENRRAALRHQVELPDTGIVGGQTERPEEGPYLFGEQLWLFEGSEVATC